MSHYTANVKLYWNGTAVNTTQGVLAFGVGDTVPDATVTRDGLATAGLVTSQPDGGTPTPTFPVTVVGQPTAGQIPAWNNSTHQWEPGAAPSTTYNPATYGLEYGDFIFHVDASTLTGSDGAALSTWPAVNGRYGFIQPTVANQPILKTAAQNGLNVVRFSTTPTFMQRVANGNFLQPATYSQPVTIVAVVKYTTAVSGAARYIVAGVGPNLLLLLQPTLHQLSLNAASNGATGGPVINDGQWHVVAGVFGTTHGMTMVDGYVYAGAATQSHGANVMSSSIYLGSGSAGAGPADADLGEAFAVNRALTPEQLSSVTAVLGAKWGIAVGSQTVTPTYYDSTSSNGQAIRVWIPPTAAATGNTLVLWSHPNAHTEQIPVAYFSYPLIHALVNAGCIVAASNMHGNSWGNNNALADNLDLYNYINGRWGVSKVILAGGSMGGLTSALTYAAGSIPNIKGIISVDGVFSQASMYANATYTGVIDTAYGITRSTLSGSTIVGGTSLPTTGSFPTIGTQLLVGNGTANVETVTTTGASTGTAVAVTAFTKSHANADQVSDYPTKISGHDPILLPAASFGVSWFFTADTSDSTVPETTNTDAFRTLIAAASPPEMTLTAHGNGHLSTSGVFPKEMLAFVQRCQAR